jgi:hypothetical protein
MNPSFYSLVKPLLVPRFGPIVAHVAFELSQKGSLSIFAIHNFTKIAISAIKESLVTLIQHQLVKWKIDEDSDLVSYWLCPENLVSSQLFYWALAFIKKEHPNKPELWEYLVQIIINGSTNQEPPIELSNFVTLFASQAITKISSPAKRIKLENPAPSYKINLTNLAQILFKGQLVTEISLNIFEQDSANLLKPAIRQICEQGYVLAQGMSKPQFAKFEDLYWVVDWIDRTSTPNLTFTLNVQKLKKYLASSLIARFISVKWSNQSLRLYNLLRCKGFLQEKTVSSLGLMPLKEVRERMYLLFLNGLAQLQEIPRTPEHNPDKTFYLWAVNEEHKVWPAFAERASSHLAQQATKITKCMQVNQVLLDKLSRRDITEEMLSQNECEARDKYREDQAGNFAQFQRLLSDLLILNYF